MVDISLMGMMGKAKVIDEGDIGPSMDKDALLSEDKKKTITNPWRRIKNP